MLPLYCGSEGISVSALRSVSGAEHNGYARGDMHYALRINGAGNKEKMHYAVT